MTVSNGNAERPTAQAPRGQSSANPAEVNADGRQGAPTANVQGQESRNGQSKDPRAEQLRPREQRAQRPLVTAGLVARVRQALRALRRSSRSTKPPSRH